MEEKAQPANIDAEGYNAEYYASLLAGLIHKLNNVLTVLSGHTGLLLLDPNLKGDVLQAVQHMSRAANVLSRCIDEATSLSRVAPMRVESINLSDLVESVECPEALSIVKKYDKRMELQADRWKLREIFEQIIRNASEAGAKSVVVTAHAPAGIVELNFRDDGQGIKPEVMRRAFDPFFTTRRKQDHLGLGLFRARGDLSRMKGRISAESDGKSYTTVIVHLPAG